MYCCKIKYRKPGYDYCIEWARNRNRTHLNNLPLRRRTDFVYMSDIPGLYGYTDGDISVVAKDAISVPKENIDIHEAIHTSDEYETRRIEAEMASDKISKYDLLNLRIEDENDWPGLWKKSA